jgi:2,3-bisphosphoglycerate-dependent phosphoglycerate mutase
MKRHIYLFRHAQTNYNRDHRFTGWIDSKLTPFGRKQAKIVARKLRSKKIGAAFCSHLSRSKNTLHAVLEFHPECKLIFEDDRIIERNYGRLSGKSHSWFVHKEGEDSYKTLCHWHKIDHLHGKEREEFERRIGEVELQVIRRSYEVVPPGGESVKMVEARVKPFIKDLLKFMKREQVNVAVSAHGNSMRPFRKYFEKMTNDQMMSLENPFDDYFDYTVNL